MLPPQKLCYACIAAPDDTACASVHAPGKWQPLTPKPFHHQSAAESPTIPNDAAKPNDTAKPNDAAVSPTPNDAAERPTDLDDESERPPLLAAAKER